MARHYFHTLRTPMFDQQSPHKCIRANGQVFSPKHRLKKCCSSTVPLVFPDRVLQQRGSILLFTVVILVVWDTTLFTCFKKYGGKQAWLPRLRYAHRPFRSMKWFTELCMCFRTFEIRQQFVITPAFVAHRCPIIVI